MEIRKLKLEKKDSGEGRRGHRDPVRASAGHKKKEEKAPARTSGAEGCNTLRHYKSIWKRKSPG
jgi:hypothetical protein